MRYKQVLFFIIGLAIIIVAFLVFTFFQADKEKATLVADLRYRTGLLADSLKESVEPTYISSSPDSLQKLVDKFTNRERLVGLAVYDNKGAKIASSADLSSELVDNQQMISSAMDSNSSVDNFVRIKGQNFYIFAQPLRYNDRVVGAFSVVLNAGYIDDSINQIWKNNILRSLVQIFLFFGIIISIVWWFIYKPLRNIVESIRSARTGKLNDNNSSIKHHAFFKPLANEISQITKSLFEARRSASEEARMRLEKLDTPWTAERLKEFIKAYLKDRKIFLVSNREPYIHTKIKNEITWSEPASGAVTALEPVMQSCGGMWIARSFGNADKETADENGKLMVPPDDPKYTLKRIWLSDKEIKGHYVGFSNEALWPLCHMAHVRPIFRKEDWREYKKVNGKFAQNLLAEIKNIQNPLILIQDFHFALLPRMIKTSRPDAQICIFWHVPWPSAEAFSICPWRKEILEGMLGADIIGFHTQQYCNNFIDTVGKEIESLIDLDQSSISKEGHISYIKPFPISIAFSNDEKQSDEKPDRGTLNKLNIKTEFIGLGVDRLDYIKGILERFKGIETFLEKYPDYVKKFTFLQIAPLSREEAEKYKEYNELVTKEAERINTKFGVSDWKPIVLEKKFYNHKELDHLYKLANFCLVTSIHDGMNLVAKEFVASRNDEEGVLILSNFTGASRDLKKALMVNPYNSEQTAEAIKTALVMSLSEQHRRMKSMREAIKNYNIYRWSAELIKSVGNLG